MSRVTIAPIVTFLLVSLSANGSSQALPRVAPESVGLSADCLERVDNVFESYIADGVMAGVSWPSRGREDWHIFEPSVGWIWRRSGNERGRHIPTCFNDQTDYQRRRDDALRRGAFPTRGSGVLVHPGIGGMQPETVAAGGGDVREMTVRDLLTHTAGLPGNGQDPRHQRIWGDRDLTHEQIMVEIGKQPLAYAPGTEFRYSDGSTRILGYLVEVLSHQRFEAFLEDRIFRPLGMVDTRFYVRGEDAHRVPAAYDLNADGVTEELYPQVRVQDLRLPTAPRGSGGLFSTANDYIRFSDASERR